jgi:DNA-binding transcriptional ArsR family regulator
MKTAKKSAADPIRQHAAAAAALLKQMANTQRLLILCNLVATERSVGELSEMVDLSQSALSQHLAKMRLAGLVESEKKGQMVFYRLSSMEVQALLSTLYLIYCKR